jgi:DNA-binding transcriptional LysR family regulator
MNLHDLRAFVAVAETGSISRAALRLHVTQSATTRRVQNFEAAMGGIALLDRRAKPLAVTPAGRQVLERCRDVLRAVAALETSASSDGEPRGELRLGIGTGAEVLVESALAILRRRFPHLQLRIGVNWTAMIIEVLRKGELDAAVAFISRDHTIPANLALHPVAVETIFVVASRDAKIARVRGRPLQLDDLTAHGWVLNPVGCAYRLAVQRAHDVAGIPLRVAAEVMGRDLQLSLVASGMGLGLASKRALAHSAHRRALRILSITDFKLEATVAVLCGRALGNLRPAVEILQSRIERELRNS